MILCSDEKHYFLYSHVMIQAIVLLLSLLFISPVFGDAGKTLVVGVPCWDVTDCEMAEVESIMKEAYSRAGLAVEFKYVPMLRDITEANDQVIDGTLSRTVMATRDFSNLIPVPFPLSQLTLAAVTVKPGIHVKSWEDLRAYKVGLLRGDRTPLLMAEKHAIDITLFNNYNSGFAMLQEGRVDMVIAVPLVARMMAPVVGLEQVYCPIRFLKAIRIIISTRNTKRWLLDSLDH